MGGWTVEAAQAVCAEGLSIDLLDGLTSLADKHLIYRDEGEVGEEQQGNLRFGMLETIREFGLEQLSLTGETPAVERWLADYYVHLVEEFKPELHGAGFARHQQILHKEYPNIRVVLRWALARREAQMSLRLCDALWAYWNVGYRREAEQVVLESLAIAEDSPPSVSYVHSLACGGYFSFVLDKQAAAYELMTRCLAMDEALGNVGNLLDTSVAYGILAWIVFDRGDYARAFSYFTTTLERERRAGVEWAEAMTLINMGDMAAELGKYERAQELIAAALEKHRRVGQKWAIAKTLADQGALYVRLNRLAEARDLLTESDALCREIGDEGLLARVQRNFAQLAMAQGDHERAARLLQAALTTGQAEVGPRYVIETLEIVAQVAVQRNQPDRALRLVGAATVQRKQRQHLAPPPARAALDRVIADARRQLTLAEADTAWAEGEAMTLDEAVAYALAAPDHHDRGAP